MATTKKTTTTAKKKTGSKAAKPREELVVFAIRLPQGDRDKIHATAGARNATRFVRDVAVAFANEDVKAFQAVLKEAKGARS